MSYSSAYKFAQARKAHKIFIASLSTDELIEYVVDADQMPKEYFYGEEED